MKQMAVLLLVAISFALNICDLKRAVCRAKCAPADLVCFKACETSHQRCIEGESP